MLVRAPACVRTRLQRCVPACVRVRPCACLRACASVRALTSAPVCSCQGPCPLCAPCAHACSTEHGEGEKAAAGGWGGFGGGAPLCPSRGSGATCRNPCVAGVCPGVSVRHTLLPPVKEGVGD